jgi:alkanesulfonate monooxygenase
MSIVAHWFLPTSGDGRTIHGAENRGAAGNGPGRPDRPPSVEYLAQVARAAEQLGFTGVLTPTGTWCEDAWLTTVALSQHTTRLRFLVAFRPGLLTPTLAAQMAATYQRITGGRLLLNVVTGGDGAEQRRFGDWLDHDQRYERTDEFLAVVRGAWSGRPYDFEGRHYRVAGATVSAPPDPVPTVYFGGSSAAALPVAARRADVYLTWGEPPPLVTAKIAAVRAEAERAGRRLRFGIRLHTISRDSAAEAWAEAARLLDAMPADSVARAQRVLAASESEGQRRMLALHGGRRDGLEIYPNLWAGVGLVRGGAGTALVGSHEQVAERIEEYQALGIEEFVLSGYPHLEEAYWFGEGVLPLLARGTGPSARRAPDQAPGPAPAVGEPRVAGAAR